MNKAILVGRLTRDPETRYAQDGTVIVSRYTLAVDRKKKGEADFIKVKAFGQPAGFAEKFFRKGMRVAISGRIETGSYTNREGQKVNTFEIVAEDQEFAQSKNEQFEIKGNGETFATVEQAELPFN